MNGLIFLIIYIFIGLGITIYFWDRDFAYDYNVAKLNGEVEDGSVCILLGVMLCFWPFFLIIRFLFKQFS